ncbi:hypothetical protein PENTCL1PPCAC_20028, partial [Pristionchus entomophagus]
QDYSETVKGEKIRVTSTCVSETAKKRKSTPYEQWPSTISRKNGRSRSNNTVLECPECEYSSTTVTAWVTHLRKAHYTTP